MARQGPRASRCPLNHQENNMLKTFTVLVTIEDHYTVARLEDLILRDKQAVRVDAFEGDHASNIDMDETRGNVLTIASKGHEALRHPPKPRAWTDLSDGERHDTMRVAREYGGGFAASLADTWSIADGGNKAKLGEAFGQMLLETFGPGTHAYRGMFA
jgi:hypothetical protein